MDRSDTLHPYNYEMDCTQYNGKYKKTKAEWIEKQIAKQYNYKIQYDSIEILVTKNKKKRKKNNI